MNGRDGHLPCAISHMNMSRSKWYVVFPAYQRTLSAISRPGDLPNLHSHPTCSSISTRRLSMRRPRSTTSRASPERHTPVGRALTLLVCCPPESVYSWFGHSMCSLSFTIHQQTYSVKTVSGLNTLILMLVLFPDVQERAHAEIDRVIGPDRLPEFSDEGNLPYIAAIVKEILRWAAFMPFGACPRHSISTH